MEIRTVRTEGLGDSTYILESGGLGMVVDPQRDIDRFLPIIEELGVDVRWVFETHLHNDYVSGARDIASALSAQLVLPAGAAPAYRHLPAFHREALREGHLEVLPLHTPGHTPEHMSYVVLEDGVESAVFSGGSLLVGSAGRSDLLGEERAETLARLQYGSVRRLALLPDRAGLYPTHGAGSFCTASAAGRSTSTIGAEKRSNPVLRHADEDSFVAAQLTGLAPFPAYYAQMGAANVAGLPPLALDRDLPRISERDYLALGSDVVVIDARRNQRYASGHLPGSIGAELRTDFGVWVGWVTPHDAPLAVVVDPEQSIDEIRRQLGRIGYDRVVGIIDDLDSWHLELASFPTHDVTSFRGAMSEGGQVVDTRAPQEWESGTIPGSTRAYSPDLRFDVPKSIDAGSPVLLACATGFRATIAASLLERQGYLPEVLLGAGVQEVIAAKGN